MTIFTFLARVTFGLTVVLLPLRWRVVLTARPNPPVYSDYTDFLLFASDITMLATLLFWGISLALDRRKVVLGKSHIWLPLLGLTLTGWVSISNSWDAPLSIYHALRLTALFFFYLFFVNEIHSFSWVILPVSLQVLSQSGIAIGQSLLQKDLGLRILGEYALDPAWSGVSIVEANGVRFLRAYGLSDHPNILGGCLAFGLILLLMIFLPGGESILASGWPVLSRLRFRLLTGLVFVLGVLSLGLTFSRSAWLAFVCGAAFLLGVAAREQGWRCLRPAWILATTSLVVLIPLIWSNQPYFSVRLNAGDSFTKPTAENQAIGERVLLNATANHIFAEHALSGVGLGASPIAMKYLYPQFPTYYQPPHFALLAAAVETGVFGATFYFLLLVAPLFVFLTQKGRSGNNPIVLTAMALLLGIAIIGLFDYYTWLLLPGRLWQWIAWGFWTVALEKRELA